MRRRAAPVALGVLLVLGAGGAACSGGSGADRSSGSSRPAIDPFGQVPDGGSASSGGPSPARPGGETAALRVGDCFDADHYTVGSPIDPGVVHEVTCTGPHQHEVIAVLTHPDVPSAPWPGDATIGAWADDHCLGEFAPYVGIEYERSRLDLAELVPDQRSWEAGDRTVLCTVHDVDFAPITGSVAGRRK